MQTPLSSSMVRTPLYRQAADVIRREFIAGHAPGFRLPSEVQLERLLGVSLITVRAALKELEVQQLVERRPGSGTYVVERRDPGKHAAILLDVDVASENLSPFYVKWLRMLQEAFREEGIAHRVYLGRLPLGTHPSGNITCQELLDDVKLDRINAIYGIFVSQKPYWGEPFLQRGIPVLDLTYLSLKESCVRSVFSWFRQENRKRIAVIGWENPFDGRRPLTKEISKLASKYGLAFEEISLAMDANGWEYGMGWERFRDIWYAEKRKPDGLFIADDMIFDDCQKAICEMGISVPDDLCVAVRTSDVHKFPEIRLPVFAWKSITAPEARAVAVAIKALVEGRPLPLVESLPFETEMLLPGNEEPFDIPCAPLSQPSLCA